MPQWSAVTGDEVDDLCSRGDSGPGVVLTAPAAINVRGVVYYCGVGLHRCSLEPSFLVSAKSAVSTHVHDPTWHACVCAGGGQASARAGFAHSATGHHTARAACKPSVRIEDRQGRPLLVVAGARPSAPLTQFSSLPNLVQFPLPSGQWPKISECPRSCQTCPVRVRQPHPWSSSGPVQVPQYLDC